MGGDWWQSLGYAVGNRKKLKFSFEISVHSNVRNGVFRMSAIERRVVVTGIGMACPGGMTSESVEEFLLSGRSAVISTDTFGSDFPIPYYAPASEFGGCIGDFGELPKETSKQIRKGLKLMCRETQMGVAAAQHALSSAGWTPGLVDPNRIGVSYGSDHMVSATEDFDGAILSCLKAMGRDGEECEISTRTWGESGLSKMSPLWLLLYLPNMPASHVAIYNDLRGPSNSIMLREVSAAASIGEAAAVVRRGRAEMMLAGATGTRVHPVRLVHFTQQTEVAARGLVPESACRPFDADRTGTLPSEGAACLVLEALEHAKSRGATIYGEICASDTGAAHDAVDCPASSRALNKVIRHTLQRSGVTPDQLDFYLAYGLGTHQSDLEESAAVRETLGNRVSVTAMKDRWGNMGCGGGMVEFAAGLLSLYHGTIPAIRNCGNPDKLAGLNLLHENRSVTKDYMLAGTMNVQGQAGAILVRRYREV